MTSHLVPTSFIQDDTRYWFSLQEFGDWHSEKAKVSFGRGERRDIADVLAVLTRRCFRSRRTAVSKREITSASGAGGLSYLAARILERSVSRFLLARDCADQSRYRFSKAWISTSVAVRLSTGLGLHHVRSTEGKGRRAVKNGMLVPSNDQDELRERARTFFVVYAGDVLASSSTGWTQVHSTVFRRDKPS